MATMIGNGREAGPMIGSSPVRGADDNRVNSFERAMIDKISGKGKMRTEDLDVTLKSADDARRMIYAALNVAV